MIEISKEVIVVTDSSKFQGRGFAFIAPVNKIHTIVTDKGILPENKDKLEKLGIRVLIT
jgi:DeoR family transcriptional regulator of aga operon